MLRNNSLVLKSMCYKDQKVALEFDIHEAAVDLIHCFIFASGLG